MPRSTKDSDDEMETKAGRRTPNPSGLSLQDTTSLRRSTRFKPMAKNNESSPESPVNENNTPQTRTTRKRAGTMEHVPVSENVRSLRPRKASVSPTNSETAATENIGTPRRTRRTLTTAPSVDSPKTSLRTRRRTRAGSETKSPTAPTKTTRPTRASSMGPEAIGDKLMEKVQTEHNETAVKTRSRASIVPSEATVIEAKEEITKVIQIELERVLPEIIEINDDESKISSGKDTDEEQPEKLNKTTQEANKGQQEDIQIEVSGESETTKNKITQDTEEPNALNEKDSIKTNEENVYSTGKETSVQSLEEESSQDGSKDFELTIANTSHESDMSNKENEATNMITDLDQNTENAKATITLQSPKPLRSSITNKLGKEKVASPLRESIKNLESVKEPGHVNLDVFSSDVDTVRKIGDTENSANKSTPTQKTNERQSRHEVLKSPILVETQLEEKEENMDKTLTIEDSPQNETAAKEIIIVELTATAEVDVEPIEIENDPPYEVQEAEDEPMDVSILEFREIISKNITEEVERPAEDTVADKSIEPRNIDLISETTENVESDELKITELPPDSETGEIETSENINAANSKNATIAENNAITDKESLNTSTNVSESEKVSSDTVGTDASNTLEKSGDANKDENNPSEDARNQSISVPDIQVDLADENDEKVADKSTNQTESTDNYSLPDKQSKVEENPKNVVTSEIDSDANTDCLFQNECSTEWKKKKKQSDSDSISSLATEKVEHESEAECDLVLVDRDAWLAAESYKLAKEKDMSDYDSDDTVVLKSRIDTIKDRMNRSSQLQTLVEESDDDLNTSKTVRRKSLQNRRKSLNKSTDKKVNTDANSQSDENSDSNDSLPQSAGRQSLSKSLIMQNTEDKHNASLKNINLNKSDIPEMSSAKKRKSLNKSVHNVSLQDTPRNKSKQNLEIDMDDIRSSLSKKNKSMNKSQMNDSSDDAIAEPVNESIKKTRISKSLNSSLKNREDLNKSSSRKSLGKYEESLIKQSSDDVPPSSLTKKKMEKDALKGNKDSKVVDVDVDSDEASIVSESDESIKKLPRFLFPGSDSDTDKEDEEGAEGSIDSDIKNEYNLDGKDITEFDDDNVPGDECRASESEYSDSEDNGSDLADFVVGDDEVEEDESDEDNENNDEDEQENGEDQVLDAVEEEDEAADHDTTSEEEQPKVDDMEDTDNEKDINDNGSEVQASEIRKSKLEKSTDSASSSIIRSGKKNRASRRSIRDTDDEEEEINISSKDKKKKANNDEDEQENVEDQVLDVVEEEAEAADHDTSSSEEDQPKVDDMEDTDNEKDINDNGSEVQASEILKSKLEKSTDSASSSIIRSGKKNRASRRSILDTDDEEEVMNNSTKAKKKKTNQNKSSELENCGQHLDESAVIFSKTIGLNRSLECSTPKNSVTKLDRLHTSLETPSLALQAQIKSKISASNLLSSIFSKTEAKDTVLETATPLRKLHKTKKIDKLLHKSLPTELLEVSEGTNLSRQTSSNVSQLNKAAATPHAAVKESRRKEKLNVDNDEIKSKKKKKEPKLSAVDQLDEDAVESEDPFDFEDPAEPEEPVTRVSKKSLKVLAKAEALQKLEEASNNKSLKKQKKRKRVSKETESETPVFNEIDERSVAVSRKVKRIDSLASNQSEEVDNVAKKKKKKISREGEMEIVVPHQVPNTISVTDDNQKVSDKPKRKVKNTVIISTEVKSVNPEIKPKKQKKIAKTATPEAIEVSAEKPRGSEKGTKASSKNPKKTKVPKSTVADSDDEPETIPFSTAREEALKAQRLIAESIKLQKQVKQEKQEKHVARMNIEKEAKVKKTQGKSQSVNSSVLEVPKKGIKRLPDELVDYLSDVPKAATKKRKISKNEVQILPSRTMPNSALEESGIGVDQSFIPLSSRGSTTQFGIVNLQKVKKQAKKSNSVSSFRQKMLARNSRQPIAAYMVYLEKQKAIIQDKFHSKPL